LRDVPLGHPRIEPSGRFDVPAAVVEIIMRNRFILAAGLMFAFAPRAWAQDPPTLPLPTDPVEIGRSAISGKPYGSVDFGGRFNSVEGDAARYQRYRDLRPGLYANNAVFGRRTDDWVVEGQAWNIGYRDQKYQVDLQNIGRLSASFLWDQIPMYISADTRTLYTQANVGVFRLDDLMQQEIQAGAKTLRNYEDQAVRFDMRTLRKVGQADVLFNANPNTNLVFKVKNTYRKGEIPFGGTFGLNNAVELPAPIDTRTTDLQTTLEWANDKGLVRLGWDGSSFDNNVQTLIWDNPLRYGPDLAGAPSQGRMSSWAGNTLNYLHATGAVSFPWRGRLTGYVALGEGTNDVDLLPFTINTAIAPVPLSRTTAQAKQQTTIALVTMAMRPTNQFSLNAKYRFSDMDVQTPVFERSTGSVAYDTSFNAVAGPSEYHSVQRNTFDVDGAFQFMPYTSLKVGFSTLGTDYTHRIWESTSENVFRVSVDTTGNQYVMLRGLYENRHRNGEGFEPEALIEVGEIPGMRHYDVADRDRQRFTLIASATPGGIFGVNATAGIGRDDYPDGNNGLQTYNTDQYSVGVSVAPDDRYTLSGDYGWERYRSLQRSRNATTAADQVNPLRDWTTDYAGKVNYLDFTLDIDRAIEKTNIRLSTDWNRSNDTYLYGLVAGSPLAAPTQLPPVKNELLRSEIDVTYEISRNLRFGVSYWYDDYNVEDFALGADTLTGIALPPVQEGQPIVATNALLLGYLYRPYTAHTGFVRLTFGW
jgi:MtrB/PioB family decaheme-associated outer membrane protein